jgi:hypothetical protein
MISLVITHLCADDERLDAPALTEQLQCPAYPRIAGVPEQDTVGLPCEPGEQLRVDRELRGRHGCQTSKSSGTSNSMYSRPLAWA